MTRGVDRGLRRAADNAAFPIEEIDAGWDDAPTSVIVPVTMSRQVSVAPTPSPWSLFAAAEARAGASEDPTLVFHEDPTVVERDEPTVVLRDEPTLTLRDEPTLTLRDEPTLTLRDEPTLTAHDGPTLNLRAESPLTAHDEPTLTVHDEPPPELGPDFVDEDSIVVLRETSAPSASEIPNFRRRPRGSIERVAVVAAMAFALAGAGRYFTSHRQAAVAPVPATPLPARAVPAAPPAVASPAPPPPATPAAAPAAEETPSLVTVVINVVPKRAIIFRGRERLGSGLVAVNVDRNDKQRLTAVLPGYEKARFTVDGTRDTVTIYLSRAAAPAPAPTAPGDSSADAPSGSPEPAPPATEAPTTTPAE